MTSDNRWECSIDLENRLALLFEGHELVSGLNVRVWDINRARQHGCSVIYLPGVNDSEDVVGALLGQSGWWVFAQHQPTLQTAALQPPVGWARSVLIGLARRIRGAAVKGDG
ncbi:hypothetical protein [Streptomyces spororaveus]|uniref:hypothetical protein n=1 Tax=Streptomyces spororaveus TaxID=284039 RepID=UPI0019204E4E|nr:hypothetical protein [Streptomyces spororaveus]